MALTRSGGDSIIKECETKGSLEFGDVRCTSGGQLSCKQLFHVRTLMNWSDEKGPEVGIIFICLLILLVSIIHKYHLVIRFCSFEC